MFMDKRRFLPINAVKTMDILGYLHEHGAVQPRGWRPK
jgi:hypothetical protein